MVSGHIIPWLVAQWNRRFRRYIYIYTVTGLTILVEYYIHLFVGFPNLEHLVNYMIAEVVAQGLVGGLLLVLSRWVLHLN